MREACDAVVKSAETLLQDDKEELSRRRSRLYRIEMNEMLEIRYQEMKKARPFFAKYEE